LLLCEQSPDGREIEQTLASRFASAFEQRGLNQTLIHELVEVSFFDPENALDIARIAVLRMRAGNARSPPLGGWIRTY
jgi:hypothetical protein